MEKEGGGKFTVDKAGIPQARWSELTISHALSMWQDRNNILSEVFLSKIQNTSIIIVGEGSETKTSNFFFF